MEQGNNPLRNSIVLSNVFSYCGLEELKRCRLVCHLWKAECRPHIRKRAKTNFSFEDSARRNEFTVLMNNADYLPMSNFDFFGPAVNQIEQFSQDFGPSVNKICLDHAGEASGQPCLASWFQNCPSIEPQRAYLPIFFHSASRRLDTYQGFNLDRMCQSSSTSSINFFGPVYQPEQPTKKLEPIDLFRLLGKFSNLKEIELTNLPTSFDTTERAFSPEAEIPLLLTVKTVSLLQACSFGITLDLLNMCPNMTTFKFGGIDNASNQIKALKSLDSSRHSKIKIIKIKGGYLEFETALEIFSLLTQSKFELEQLSFSNCLILEDRNNQLGGLLCQIFQQQSTTLHKLVLPTSFSLALTFPFPQMVALQKIAFPVHEVGFSFPSLSVYFPNLRILDLKKFDSDGFNEKTVPFINNIAAPTNSSFNLHRLLLPTMLQASQHHLVVSLANEFPLVENITILYQEPEILECIWKSWPNLIGLDISGPTPSPFCVVNIEDRDNEASRLAAAYLGLEASDYFQLRASQDYRQPDFTIEIIKPSIRDLQELRTLKLSSFDLTDITGYLGISMLQKLMNLELHCPNITQTCLDDLAKRLPSLISWSNENDKRATLNQVKKMLW